MTEGKYTLEDVQQTFKKSDAWWTVVLVDPIASRLTVLTANKTNITPNQISIVSFIIGMIAAYNFYLGTAVSLLIGALLYHISFILDCMDGKIARLKGTGSMFGVLLDIMLDHIRVVICGIALMVGQYNHTGDSIYIYLIPIFMGVYFLRHYDALTLYKLRRQMNGRLKKARNQLKRLENIRFRATWLQLNGESETVADLSTLETRQITRQKIDLQQQFKSRFAWFLTIRERLRTRRIRMHLFSGIEFQMFIFIVAPIIGMIKETVIISSLLLFLFELAIIYKLWLSTRDYERELTKLNRLLAQYEQDMVENE